MSRKSLGPVLVWTLISVLIGSVIPNFFPLQSSFATHSDIDEVTVDDTTPDPGDEVVISGIIDGADENDDVDITIRKPSGGSDSADTQVDDNEEFSEPYDIPSSAADGIHEIEVKFGTEDPMYAYFLIDEDDDPAPTRTNEDSYGQGADVEVSGNVEDPVTGVDDVDIIVLDPEGNDIGPGSSDLDSSDDFEETVELDSDAHIGIYAVIVEHDGDEVGWAIFEVVEDGGSNEITASLEDATLGPGDEVVITGNIDENDVDLDQVILKVEDPDGATIENDSVQPENDGTFEFSFDLDDDAEVGTYDVTLEYIGYDDKTLTFTVSTSTGGGSSGGSGSGSSGGLTARLSKTSLLAGETLTVSGVVPSIEEDPVNVSVLKPDGRFISASYPEPDSDKSYSTTLRLPSTLEEDEDYSVVVSYDNKEVKVLFDITGVVSGGTGGAVTVETDKETYASGSTVQIAGDIASDTFVEGQQLTLQVYNPDNAAYRFDPITPESDGSYSYSMKVGGPLAVSGEWKVKVTFAGESAETTFDLTGGAPSSPKFNLIFEDQTYPIDYQSDATVKNMFIRPTAKELVISLDANDEGTLTIELPREVIDAVEDGEDIKYVVVATDIDTGDEEVIEVTESATDEESRTLVIDYPAGTDLIEIQGTTVVPEFGVLVAIVLAAALTSAMVTTRFSDRLGIRKFW